MAIRNVRPLTFRPRGLTDTLDGTNAFKGSMASLSNLVPSPTTKNAFVPRPAATSQTTFGAFNTPTGVTAMLMVGTRVYGMISTAHFAGKDEPFCYDIATNAFVAITGTVSGLLPATQSTSGDWTPPTMAMIGSRIYVTHPGFVGGGVNFGFIDVSGFSSTTITGNTHGNKTIDTLSVNVLQAGWQVGMDISDLAADLPAGTYITSIASNGLSVQISANATGSNATTFTVVGGTFAAPLWGAGNTNGTPLPAVPVAVEQFNGRAWWAVNNSLVFSDALNGSQVTNATQVLVLGDTTAVTALAPLALASPITGGVVQSLVAFKGDSQYWQVTGDQATQNLALNQNSSSVGCLAPNTICTTPLGLVFVAPDGVRIIDISGKASDPIGADGDGVCNPFLNAINPSRMCAAYNQNVLRISLQNGAKLNQPYEEYWLDFGQKVWTGPHTFPATLIVAYQAPSGALSGHGFVMAPQVKPASLFLSSVTPTFSSTYTENGAALSWTYATSLFPDDGELAESAIMESTLAVSLPSGQPLSILAADESGNTLDTVSISSTLGQGATWGSFNWGSGLWGALTGPFEQYTIAWHAALVFKQMSLTVSGPSVGGMTIGNFYAGIQRLGYRLLAR